MPQPFKKPKEVITKEQIQAAEREIVKAGGRIDGLITNPPKLRSKGMETVRSALRFLTEKCGYGIKQREIVGTSKTTWKGFERRVATFFGAKRVPLSGSNSGHGTNSDSLHPLVYIESKYRKHAFSVVDLFIDTETKALRENKVPVVAIKQKFVDGYLLLVRPEDLSLLSQLKDLSSDSENLTDYEIVIITSSNGKRTTKELRRKDSTR